MLVDRFPYKIIYEVDEGIIIINSVDHNKRSKSYKE
jgi:mRNA-degrading endonuclease RelE of RelBE toxin-antitoxin system